MAESADDDLAGGAPGAGESGAKGAPGAEMHEALRPATEALEAPQTLPAAMERLSRLAAELATAQGEVEEGRDRLLRERAELENFKRRMQRDKSEALRYANEPLLRELLPVVDNLQRAMSAARGAQTDRPGKPQAGPLSALVNGVELVLHQLSEVLARFGVARLATKAQTFDPAHHEALAQIESPDHPAGTVVEEHLPGYRLHDRLLRAAQVTVAKAPASRAATSRSKNGTD
jgi:molecular chaperone GrpE